MVTSWEKNGPEKDREARMPPGLTEPQLASVR
jgi:hypothetical protein